MPGGPAGSTCGTKAPPPTGGGARRGGRRGGDSDPPSEAPSLLLGDGDIHLRVGFIWEPPRKSVLRGAVHLGPNKSSFCGQGHLLRHRSRFHALLGWDWRKMNNWFPSALIPPHSPAFYCFCS